MPLDNFNPNDPYRRFIQHAQTPVFFDYSRNPITGIVPQSQENPAAAAADVGTPPPPRFMPTLPSSIEMASNGGVGSPSGVGGQGANSGGVSVGPSSVSGVGPGSIASNISNGNNIAALMGLIGLAAPAPVGMIASVPSVMGMLGINGLTNGLAISNDQSSNNVAADIAAIEGLANAIGIGPNSAGIVGEDAAASSPGANAPAAATVGANTDGMNSEGNTGTNGSSADAADSGSTYAAGGRAYARFKDGGRPRGAIRNPQRNEYPELWSDPREIARKAEERLAPEDPSMKELFGVTRQDLYDRFKDRKGTVSGDDLIWMPTRGRPSEAVQDIMTRKNAQRMQDTLVEGSHHAPGVSMGMHSWYPLDPIYERLVQLHGAPKADQAYTRFNTFMGGTSPLSTVESEIARGTAANTLFNQGRFGDFEKYARVPGKQRASFEGFPSDMIDVPGSIGHKSHVHALKRFIDQGALDTPEVKVPLYVGASNVPHLGNQTDRAVPDSHFTRGSELTSTRRANNENDIHGNMNSSEGRTFLPWFKDEVASPLDIEAVPAQARLWGLLSGITGVKTQIGAPKLELISKHIMNRAKKLGENPYDFRDAVISGERFARGGRTDRHPVPRSTAHLYRQFVHRELTPTY